ncbi:MAG: hypothetical protein ACLP4R_28975 [Solirubrobacteraceae bacterium]
MATELTAGDRRTPAARAMDEAIELAIEGRSPYPDTAAFIDAEAPGAVEAIKKAADEGRAVVLVYADGSTRVLRAAPVTR